jgi:hypothetical protein
MDDKIIDLIPVEGHANFGRDPDSNAILNTDNSGYDAYIRAREANKKKDEEINSLKEDIAELKEMMKMIVSELHK